MLQIQQVRQDGDTQDILLRPRATNILSNKIEGFALEQDGDGGPLERTGIEGLEGLMPVDLTLAAETIEAPIEGNEVESVMKVRQLPKCACKGCQGGSKLDSAKSIATSFTAATKTIKTKSKDGE